MPIAVVAGVVGALLLLAWGGVELNHLIHAYPGQFYMGVFAFLFVVAGMAARVRASHRPVRLRPAEPEIPPLPKAIQAAPVLTAIASPAAEDAAPECEGPECANKLDDDPWQAQPPGAAEPHLFCSRECASAWLTVKGFIGR